MNVIPFLLFLASGLMFGWAILPERKDRGAAVNVSEEVHYQGRCPSCDQDIYSREIEVFCEHPIGLSGDVCPGSGTPASIQYTPVPPATEGQAGSGEQIPGYNICPLDGEPLGRVIQNTGKPTLYIHADGFTWHPDASERIKASSWQAQPPAPAHDTAEVLAEETGELCRAVLKREQKVRGTAEEWTAEIRKEIGDCLIKLLDIAAYEGMSASGVLTERWTEVRQRDWRANSNGHGLPVEAAQARLADPGRGRGEG